MNTYPFILGIDVSKSTLDVCLMQSEEGSVLTQARIANTAKAIKGIPKLLATHRVVLADCLPCFENTGVYSVPLALFCSQRQWAYAEIAALEIKRSNGIKRGKSDKVDARAIALYGVRHMDKIRPSSMDQEHIQQLKLLVAERDKLLTSLKLFKATSENQGFLPTQVYEVVQAANTRTLKALKQSLKIIEERITEIIEATQGLAQQVQLLRSIPGIGELTALQFVLTTHGFSRFSTSRQFACYTGIAPFEYTSGSSIRGRTRVSPLANKKMKSLLHMASLTAIKYDPELKLYYNRKKAEGKHSMLVLNNIKFKLVQRAFAVINRQSPYVVSHQFAA